MSRSPNFKRLEGVVSQRILDATRIASQSMADAGIPHALIGALAVGSYGYIRSTKDIDFIVGKEAFNVHGGGIVTHKPGVPISVGGIIVDAIDIPGNDDAIEHAKKSAGIPIVSAEALVYLKLIAARRRDKEDIVELLKLGLDENPIRKYIEAKDSSLIELFNDLLDQADES